ncbi:hypothetical protein [Thermoflavimicrobium dichotomicum]|uniref:Uncharacterized protein n=1 Tax=Thermoflavimicrobium dichotomicum TaxID=46223 RepID=A0A1I3TVA6_9BACL|nr:hypothetical protein [Thermoflavimicrobium dichotomicum]SFJ73586.1 hypothetical protein SAMN05421852_11952 [Thermoflavimicrobium dichotomicum]
MSDNPIREECSSYQVLLTRKTRMMRIMDNLVVLLGLLVLLPFFEWRSTPFILAFLFFVLLVFIISPLIYLYIFHPRYTLYSDRLVVRIGKKVDTILLTEIEQEYDLRYYFRIRGKRTPLLVSDSFIDELNYQLEVIKRGWKT